MRIRPFALLFATILLGAQGWDATRQASGWAFQEVDGSLVFFDPVGRSLRTWTKGSGLLSSLPLSLPEPSQAPAAVNSAPPPKGASDYEAAGALLYGTPRLPQAHAKPLAPRPREDKPAPEALPGEARPPDRRRPLDLRRPRPSGGSRGPAVASALEPHGHGRDDTVYIAEGARLAFIALDPAKGPRQPGQAFFTCQDAMPARAALGRQGRGPLLSWAGKDVLFGTFTPNQVKSCGAPESKGLVLARFDLAKGTLEWLPTNLSEGHRLLGLLEAEAVFLAPTGGLAYAPIH